MLPSTLALILANLVPLLGALLFGWNIFEVFALYWTESAVIGAFTIVRLLRAGAFLPLFFCIHFGLFLFVHSLAIMALIGAPDGAAHFTDRSAPLRLLTTAASSSHGLGLWALIISHGITFATDQRDRAQGLVAANRLMFAPYRRIFAMHATLLLGAIALAALGDRSSPALLALLVIAKTTADALALRAEHRQPPPPEPPRANAIGC